MLERPIQDNLKKASKEPLTSNTYKSKLAKWESYHQNVLVNLTRVSIHFHQIASMLLYHDVIIANPYSFFYGIDYTPPKRDEDRNMRITKTQQLNQVKSVTLIYALSTPSTTPTMKDFDWIALKSRRGSFQGCDIDLVKMYLISLDSVNQATTILENFSNSISSSSSTLGKAGILCQLQNLAIGISFCSKDQNSWLSKQCIPSTLRNRPGCNYIQKVLENKRFIGEKFAQQLNEICLSLYTCYHANHGSLGSLFFDGDSTSTNNAKNVKNVTVYLDPSLNMKNHTAIQLRYGSNSSWIITKEYLQIFIPTHWGVTTVDGLGIAVSRLLKRLRKVLIQSIRKFPLDTYRQRNTELVISLPVSLEALRLGLGDLRPKNRSNGATLYTLTDKEICHKLEGYLMNNSASWYTYRGVSIRIKQSTEGIPMDVNRNADRIKCGSCGLHQHV
ncbi:uncharacterized protein L201_000165 [Kwoniella dendrophila CBS 6074]|uniref:Uncharacterized protein n=1 Tax=Kwoniella dendrophila CBS 6074 TaxID=1295534 RepID=A0AAX4JLK9_9TREE